jgi:subtilisin family serine protease/bacillopeptidase F (M6 metalloprotease family)
LLITLIVFGFFVPSIYAENYLVEQVEDTEGKMLQKIDSKVLDILDQEKYIEVLVYLKDRIEPNNIAEVTKKKVAVTSTTPYGAKLEVRKAVVEALQDQAEKTQVNLLKYIEQEKERGNVAEYKPYYIVNMIYVKATKEVIENIAYLPEVEKIFKNEFIKLERTVKNNPSGELMGKNGEGTEWNIERIGANLVWDELGIDGTGAVIGLIDTGVVWDHPALKEKWRGYDPVTGAINPEGNWYDAVLRRDMPYDIQGFSHGTQVLGTILGQEPDGSNKIGVAPGAKWIAAKAFTIDGGLSNEIIAAGEWMLAPGGDPTRAPDVINNSWGGSNEKDDWFRDVVKAWRAAEIVPVFSVGTQKKGEPEQGPGSIANPGNYPESFAVAATDKNNIRAPFSKLGPSPYDEDLIKPEISAPGVDIRSSVAEGYESGLDGTSMAAPHITGTVALLASANSSLKASEVEKIIKDTATELTDDDYPNSPNCGYGYGLVNAFEAVSAAISGTGLITGRVLVEGEDSEEPVIVHEQEVKKAFINEDIEITAAMSDDISIVKAELLVKVEGKSDWMLVQMQRVAGDHKDGIYKAKITSDMLEEPGIIYKIRARDFDDNVVVSKDYTIEIIFGIVPGEYETDFETEPLGWTFTGDWEWGEPREGVGPTPYKGTKLVGTKLEGVYSYNSDSYLITPPIDLRDESFTSATLRFYQWYETPEIKYDNDKGQIYISDDNGENWVPVGPEYSGNGKEWHEILINLKEYIGSPNPVYVAFRFTSDDSWVKDGWYLDNVRLIGKDEEPPAAPTGLIAEVTLAGVRLSWDPSPEVDLEKYKIYRSEVPGQYTDEIGSISRTSFLDETAEAGKTYYYVITAVDISGNESEYSEEVSAIAPPVVVIFRTNFEDDDGGFTTGLTQEGPWYKNYWEWGVPTSGPNAALTGTKVWATNLAGNYDEYSRGYIKSPAMIIPENVTAALFFDYWIDSESVSFDYGYVEISEDDGATWTKVTENIAGHIRKWEKKEVNLADYSGKTIQIRFCFDSDGAFHYEGWYLDNVLVSGVDTTAAANISIVEPVAVSAETKEEVKEDKPFQEGTVETPKFSFRKDKTNDYEIIADDLVEKEATSGIPADAVVTVLETGCSVRTDPATGEFSMRHIANESEEEYWTLRAEAYGYYPREVKVHLEKGGETNEIIFLETIPRGTIKGKVFDSYYKTAIANAEIKVKEDPRIAPVMTDEEGEFTLEGVLEGSCTLKIAADWFYERGEIEVTVVGNQINEVEIPLKRSLSYEDVIIYDQGQAKNSVVMDNVNDGTAVRFTPPHYGKVEGAYVYFRGWEFPIPGGDEIGIAIFDTDERGNPAEMQ